MRRLVDLALVCTLIVSTVSAQSNLPSTRKPKGKGVKAPASEVTDQQRLAGFDQYVEKVMADWKILGIAVAVISDGKVVLQKGYGLRDVEKKLPVTPKTIFPIASITKSFTVSTLSTLVDDGVIEWDRPVREYLPGFRMYDPVATERMTPRDLVTHRSGLPRHDWLWYNSTFTRKQMFERLRYLEPSRDFRSTYQYNNLMYMTAGYLTGEMTGGTWENAVRKAIFEPVGMTRSSFSVADVKKSDDFSLSYERNRVAKQEVVKQVDFSIVDEMGPTGSINSSLEDMTNYLLMHVNGGRLNGKQVISTANVLDMQSPHMVTPAAVIWPELSHVNYGMGFFINSYRGNKMVYHSGNLDGFSLLLSMLPSKKAGVIVLTNLSSNPVTSILTYNVYDRLLGLDEVPWNTRLLERRAKSEASEDAAKDQGFTVQKKGTRPAHPIEEYVGEYEHPGYGTVAIGRKGDDLTLTYNRFTSTLKHFHYEVFSVPEDPFDRLEKIRVTFETDVDGEIPGLRIAFQPDVNDIQFQRQPDRQMRERAFLEQMVGEYELGPTPVNVRLRGGKALVMSMPGQATRELIPVRGTTFKVKGLAGYTVEFKREGTAAAKEAVFYQPNGVFLAKRKQQGEAKE